MQQTLLGCAVLLLPLLVARSAAALEILHPDTLKGPRTSVVCEFIGPLGANVTSGVIRASPTSACAPLERQCDSTHRIVLFRQLLGCIIEQKMAHAAEAGCTGAIMSDAFSQPGASVSGPYSIGTHSPNPAAHNVVLHVVNNRDFDVLWQAAVDESTGYPPRLVVSLLRTEETIAASPWLQARTHWITVAVLYGIVPALAVVNMLLTLDRAARHMQLRAARALMAADSPAQASKLPAVRGPPMPPPCSLPASDTKLDGDQLGSSGTHAPASGSASRIGTRLGSLVAAEREPNEAMVASTRPVSLRRRDTPSHYSHFDRVPEEGEEAADPSPTLQPSSWRGRVEEATMGRRTSASRNRLPLPEAPRRRDGRALTICAHIASFALAPKRTIGSCTRRNTPDLVSAVMTLQIVAALRTCHVMLGSHAGVARSLTSICTATAISPHSHPRPLCSPQPERCMRWWTPCGEQG